MTDLVLPLPSRPYLRPPMGACDCHTHIFGPRDIFPLRHPPEFPLPTAPIELHRQMREAAGLDRAVLVQPAHYGFDHTALIEALTGDERVRGIGLADATVSDRELDLLHGAGVRGLRFTELRNPDGSIRAGSVGVDHLIRLAPRLRELGWQAHLWASAASVDMLLAVLVSLNIPVVLDHMGMPSVAAGAGDPKFQRLLSAVRDGALWVKLSLCRVSSVPDYADVRPFHDALVEANPHRLLWGSDWPFIRMMERSPNVGALLDRFSAWVDDTGVRHAILAKNPARLFEFDPVTKGQ